MLTGLTFFLVLSFLILIHEFGHYYVAKRSGMLVEEFGLGLPPRLWGKKIGQTLYSINLLPFGGFVKIFGDNPEDLKKNPSHKKLAFNRKPWYQQLLVILAGPTMNFLLAVAVVSFLFTKGTYVVTDRVTVVEAQPGSPAILAGLQKDDIILTLGNKKITNSQQLIKLAKIKAGKPVALKIKRGVKVFKLLITPRTNPPKNQGALGAVVTDLELKKYPWYQAPWKGLAESLKISLLFYKELGRILWQLVTLQHPQVEVAGPVGIARLTGQAVRYGFEAVVQLTGLLSLNLALINLIPFPALDGGQLSFILFEQLTRRKLSETLKARINAVGFAVLLFLLLLITIKDLHGLF